jgi:hypothetical protein
MSIVEGRQTAAYDQELVVLVIGFRVNKLRAFRQWLPVARAMNPMLQELLADKDSGLLGFRVFPGLRTTTMIQYWDSAEKLQAWANDPDRTHRPAWKNFYKYAYQGNNVGAYHETYVVPAGHTETIYANMPVLGLGKVAGVVPVNRRGQTAAERLGRK